MSGPTASFFSLALGVLTYIALPDENVPAWSVVVSLAFALFVALVFFHAALTAHKNVHLPEVVHSMTRGSGEFDQHGLLLLSPSHLFSLDSGVSIYTKKSGFEILVGIGRVINIQQDGRIQVEIVHKEPGEKDTWSAVFQSPDGILERLIVKPSVPRYMMETPFS